MKTDKLEKFIRGHRDEFDDLTPDPGLWDKIRKREAESFSINWTNILIRAAALVVIFVSSWIFIDYITSDNQVSGLADNGRFDPVDSEMVQDLLEAEYYYTNQIEERKEEFYCLTAGNPVLRDDVDMEMGELDQVFKNLKEDLKDNADNQEVVTAMIRNYRLKLEILEQILTQLRSAEKNNDCHENENVHM